jgi:hypothetical protein
MLLPILGICQFYFQAFHNSNPSDKVNSATSCENKYDWYAKRRRSRQEYGGSKANQYKHDKTVNPCNVIGAL